MTINNNNQENDDDDDNALSSKLSTMIMTMTMNKKLKHVQYEVVVHPLVLLSVADHYHRVARGTRKRVIGILLGQTMASSSTSSNGVVMDVTNSFALPFEEDLKNPVRLRVGVVIVPPIPPSLQPYTRSLSIVLSLTYTSQI
jgi:hypothetical protein